ncbi:hypothetical protein [Serinicoccus kebangsaanensis]|uniref:hypothetical protein n=1 Tax=Serinicoccus kebangsaanensis TaxID=2602069 RepID=UPI00178C3CA9|nr:hypothetical protein [Serinicoccus kebangsaanensis]
MTTLDPDSADLTLLQDRQVAVLGFDAVGAAHALNLRDSGVDVWVGIDPESRLAARAEIEGLPVVLPAEAVSRCDIVLVPGPGRMDQERASVQPLVDEHTEPGDLVIVTSAATVREDGLTVPEEVDLALLRTLGDGERVREEYLDGRGSPALVAVEHDRSGAAWATLTAYAAAMGSLRSGAIVTTIEHEAVAMAAARDRIHAPLQEALESAYDELASSGVEPEVAYVALVHELKAHVDQIYSAGFASHHGPSGQATGSDGAVRSRREAAAGAHPLERAGRTVREMTSWLR